MHRLSRLLSRSSIAQKQTVQSTGIVFHNKLLNLPLEILIAIEALLLYENAVAFSLTCKAFYELFFKLHKPSSKHHGREAHLLRLIEKDLPNHLSCPVHQRLYIWQKVRSRHFQCPLCTSNHRLLTGSFVICNKGCKSAFYGVFEPERRLMLRHGLLGPEFGISRRSLDHVCKRSLSKRANEVAPKIVKGSLMVWRTHHYTARIDSRTWADFGLEHFDEAICVHSEVGLQALLCAAIQHAKNPGELTMARSASVTQAVLQRRWQCPTMFKCQKCATDVRVRMDQTSAHEVIVRFDVYQDLGGLDELTLAQRQVLGAKLDWRQQELTTEERAQRREEDLERRYHGEEEPKHNESDVWSAPRPKHTMFLNQWTYSQRRSPSEPISFQPNLNVLDTEREGSHEIHFISHEAGVGE